MSVPTFVLFFLPFIAACCVFTYLTKSRRLRGKRLNKVVTFGIKHYTDKAGVDGIIGSGRFIAGKEGIVYFFINEPIADYILRYNLTDNKKRIPSVVITLTNLSSEQAALFKYRAIDNSLICKKEFIILNENVVNIERADSKLWIAKNFWQTFLLRYSVLLLCFIAIALIVGAILLASAHAS